jgi:hypothetical protein
MNIAARPQEKATLGSLSRTASHVQNDKRKAISQAQMRKNVVSLQKIGASGRPLLLSNVTLFKKLNICHIHLERRQICPITKPFATGSYGLHLKS